ncbi:gamma-glutamyltranspeptidase [Ameyamaea chiangmaiensis NBRC 103196]|nr:gamma-glutamyltranspeptidase [Ameyamaea chiangmaiensis NBRC 103196]
MRDTLWGPSHPYLSGYVGIVVADEPQAAVAGHDVLVRGGNAADAATAVGLALAVTLPSRASLGSGGACLAYRPGQPGADSFLFLPVGGSVSGSRPAAVPMVVRGLYRMQIQYGSVDFSETLPPAIRLARAGATVSSQLASDLEVVKAPLLEDEGMSAVFSRGDGSVLQAGDTVAQPALAATLERIRHVGPGDLYNGALASSLAEGAATAGGGLTAADIRAALPARLESLALQNGGTRIDFVAPPADGGLGMAAAWHAAQGGTSVGGIGQSSVAAWRAAHSQTTDVAAAQAFVSSPPSGGRLPNLPASTSFAVVDRTGEAVACDLTMNNLFGTGRMAGSTGIVLGVAPGRNPAPLLPIAIAHHNGVVQAVVAASGQNDAADAAAAGLSNALAGRAGTANVGAGRVNSIVCGSHTCSGATDVRGGGLATGTN